MSSQIEKNTETFENTPIEKSDISTQENDISNRVDSTGGESDAGQDGYDDGNIDLRQTDTTESEHIESNYTSTTEYKYTEKVDTPPSHFNEQFSQAAQQENFSLKEEFSHAAQEGQENSDTTDTNEDQDAPAPTPPTFDYNI